LPALRFRFGFDESPIKTFFEQSPTGADVSTTAGNIVFRPIAERSGFVKQLFADQHFGNQFISILA
jgi:hypothetical protein|tara:strand:- start:2187 stop:2384 length:198 start_codon:yes stop_codon:yes gene_type:complete